MKIIENQPWKLPLKCYGHGCSGKFYEGGLLTCVDPNAKGQCFCCMLCNKHCMVDEPVSSSERLRFIAALVKLKKSLNI